MGYLIVDYNQTKSLLIVEWGVAIEPFIHFWVAYPECSGEGIFDDLQLRATRATDGLLRV